MAATIEPTPTPVAGWKARWCWTSKHLSRPWNYYALFRHTVELPAKPLRFVVRISADARYVLYVNGRRIHQGPARSFAPFQSYDTLELADAIQAGTNSICAVVHQFGVPTFQSAYRDASGFLLDGVAEVEGQQISIHTPEGWVCRPAKGWKKETARLSVQLGFQEHYDAGAEPPDWMSPQYPAPPEDGWQKPVDLGPVGIHPWVTVEARNAPLLADHVERFTAVTAQFSGENARGYKVADDVYHVLAQETPKREKTLLENPEAMLRDDGEVSTIAPPGDGQFALAVLDLGQVRAGHLMLNIAQAAGDEIIDIIYSEDVDKNGLPRLLGVPTPGINEEAFADRYRCRTGAQQWEPFAIKGFRYATLIFRNIAQPLKVRHVAVRQVHAAMEDVGAFECSDKRLNQIWRVSQETLRNCMFDAFVDCPSRQAQWWGDARVQFKANTYAFGDVSLLMRGIRQVAQSQAIDGSVHACPPADLPLMRLPNYMMTWVGTLWDHYFHTGRADLLRACLPAMHRVFDFLAAHEIRDGLIGAFDGFAVFLDRADLYKANFSAPLNLIYLAAVRWAAAICHVLGEPRAAVYSRKAAMLAAAVERYFWDAKAKVWRDGFDAEKNAIIDSISQHTNAMAILLRLKPETHVALAKDVLLKPSGSRRGKVITASPFFYAYVLDALAEANLRLEVVHLVAEKWGAMIDAGATTFWEDWDGSAADSRCHGCSASPVYHLSQQILGVSPVEPGWKLVRIAPCPGKLEFARGRVPSPLGIIKVEWEKAGEDQLAVRVDLPAGMTGEFVGPLGETRMLAAGGTEFHT